MSEYNDERDLLRRNMEEYQVRSSCSYVSCWFRPDVPHSKNKLTASRKRQMHFVPRWPSCS